MNNDYRVQDFFIDKVVLACPTIMQMVGTDVFNQARRDLSPQQLNLTADVITRAIASRVWSCYIPQNIKREVDLFFHEWRKCVEKKGCPEENKNNIADPTITILANIQVLPPVTRPWVSVGHVLPTRTLAHPIYESSFSVYMQKKYNPPPTGMTAVQNILRILNAIKTNNHTEHFWQRVDNIKYKSDLDIHNMTVGMGAYHFRTFFIIYLREYVYLLHCRLTATNYFKKYPLFNDYLNLAAFVVFNGENYYLSVMRDTSTIDQVMDHHYMIGTPWETLLTASSSIKP